MITGAGAILLVRRRDPRWEMVTKSVRSQNYDHIRGIAATSQVSATARDSNYH